MHAHLEHGRRPAAHQRRRAVGQARGRKARVRGGLEQQLDRHHARFLEVRRDARERDGRVVAEKLVVVDADDRHFVRHIVPLPLRGGEDVERHLVVDGEDAAGLGQAAQEGGDMREEIAEVALAALDRAAEDLAAASRPAQALRKLLDAPVGPFARGPVLDAAVGGVAERQELAHGHPGRRARIVLDAVAPAGVRPRRRTAQDGRDLPPREPAEPAGPHGIAFGHDAVRLPEIQHLADVRPGVDVHQHDADAARRRHLVDSRQAPAARQIPALVDVQDRLDDPAAAGGSGVGLHFSFSRSRPSLSETSFIAAPNGASSGPSVFS